MSDNPTIPTGSASWTEQEIRQQPTSWLRSLKNMTHRHDELTAFLSPLMQQADLRIVLTGAGTSAFIGEMIAPWLSGHCGKKIEAIATTDLVTNPEDYLNPSQPMLLVSFARSGNSPESVAAVDLANQRVTSCHHLIITCNEAGHLYKNASNIPNALALLMPEETHDRAFAMTSSMTTMMASCLAIFAPDVVNSNRFQDVANCCTQIINSQGSFSDNPFGNRPYERIVYLGSGGLQGAAREASLKVLELTAGKLASFYDSSTGFRHGPKSIVNDKTLIVVMISSHPYTRQYDLDLLAELRRDSQAMRVVAISATTSSEIEAGPHILLPPSREFLDIEQAFCFLIYAQIFALTESINAGITPDTPSSNGTVNRVVKGVIIHPWKG